MTPVTATRFFRAAALGLIALAFGCGGEPEEPQQRFVKLNVKTVDVSGRPVAMVRFYINGKKFGITDDEGNFQGKYEAKDSEVLAFNVEAPQGYSVPPNTDQSQWQITVKYPKSGKLEVDFSATLQRPERDYLFMVRAGEGGVGVKVNGTLVGKTSASGDALLRVSGVPGTKFTASAGKLTLKGAVFAEDDEIYLLTDKKQGALGGGEEPEPEPEVPVEPEKPEPAAQPDPQPTVVAKADPPPSSDDPFAGIGATTRREAPKAADPEPVAEPEPIAADPEPVAADPEPVAEPEPFVAPDPAPIPDPEPIAEPEPFVAPDPAPIPDPEPIAKPEPLVAPEHEDNGLGDLFADPIDDPPPTDPIPEPVADDTPTIQAEGVKRSRSERERVEGSLGDGLIDDGNDTVDPNAMDSKATVAATKGPSVAVMSRQEISDRLGQINKRLDSSGVLQKADVDFLSQIDKTHPGYREANRLLAEFYFQLKDYKRQSNALEEATRRGKYKHDPAILLSLAKSYAQQKNYGKALKTMGRVERKMRRLPARQKADAFRFHAEMLEFEFLRQYHDDPKRANVSLVDKAITKWERYRTFSQGSNPGAVSKANQKIEKLSGLKREMEL